MSEFAQSFASAYEAAQTVFGDTCTIAGQTYTCVIHGFDLREGIRPGQSAGRSQEAAGVVILSVTQWEDAKTRLVAQGKKTKGAHITIPGGTFRVLNDPDAGYDSHTVELQLGPLTT
jgi:hypothetical protein